MQSVKQEITEAEQLFYGQYLPVLTEAIIKVLAEIAQWRDTRQRQTGRDPLIYTTARIKSAESMRAKLLRLGRVPTAFSALTAVHDAAGVRAVCLFTEEIYQLAEALEHEQGICVLQQKDYIKSPKPSGYRSYHMIIAQQIGTYVVPVEIQLRTIAMDSWAALEHEIQYKQDVPQEERQLICAELKRCADEIASTEISMETIRELIAKGGSKDHADLTSRR